jgi:hypothetical protein
VRDDDRNINQKHVDLASQQGGHGRRASAIRYVKNVVEQLHSRIRISSGANLRDRRVAASTSVRAAALAGVGSYDR